MLRKFAIVYLVIQSVYFSYTFYRAIGYNAWLEPMFWANWPINLLGLLAVASFAFKKKILMPMYWQAVLIIYIGLRIYELVPKGLFVKEWSMQHNLLIGAQYLWLVLPSILAMLYLSFSINRRS
jgi:hypothetical protein